MTPARAEPARRIGRYLLGRPIGAGGMATVFAARQEGPVGVGRLVALKVMSTSSRADEGFRALFHREAILATRLEHPNIVRTYEVGELDGDLFLAMEYVHGSAVSRIKPPTKAPLAIAIRIVSDVLRGLHAAHELRSVEGTLLGLVHQDVTPQNIVVGQDGVAKLLDFGVARLSAIDTSRTDTVRGKPAYLAPEQIEGARIDRRVDLFAVGIVLFELITGTRLFSRPTIASVYRAVLFEPIPRLRDVVPAVPAGLDELVARALCRAPEGRYASAEEMRVALAHVAASEGIPEASGEVVAAWMREVAAASASPQELEREILEADRPTLDAGGVDVAVSVGTPVVDADPTVVDPTASSTVKLPTDGASAGDAAAPSADEAVPGLPSSRRPVGRALAIGAVLVVVVASTVGWIRSRSDAASSVVPGSASASASASGVDVAEPSASGMAPLVSAEPVTSALAPPPSSPRAGPTIRRSPAASVAAPASAPPQQAPSAQEAGPPAVAAVAQGHLSVWSNVWGHVSIDGVEVGSSPLKALPIAPGSHVVSVRTADGTQAQNVTIEPGSDKRLKFTF